MPEIIEMSLCVSTRDEAQAAVLAQRLALLMVGLSAEPNVSAWIDTTRIPMCDHEHGRVES